MTKRALKQQATIFTIGHSTRSLEDLITMLKSFKVTRLIDVRTVPRSRYNPQFNKEALPDGLLRAGIGYLHMPDLGGLRHPKQNSPNTGWRNDSFRGFADYMQTEAFREGIDGLADFAKHETIAVMCAESVPWRCHRSLIADALQVRGIDVKHIMSRKSCKDHALTPFIKVRGLQITYPLRRQDERGLRG